MKLRIPFTVLVPALLALAAFCWWRSATADERRVKRAFAELSTLAHKGSAGENPVLAALDSARLAKLVAETVELSAPELRGRAWKERRDDLVRQAFAAKARASSLSLAFEDVSVRFPGPGRAVATGEVTLEGSLPDFGGPFGGTREFSVTFVRDASSGGWLASRVAVTPIASK